MGDMAEVFRAMRDEKARRKRITHLRNMPTVRALIFEARVPWRALPGGYRFGIPKSGKGNDLLLLDFWPSSGKWQVVGVGGQRGRVRQGAPAFRDYIKLIWTGELLD